MNDSCYISEAITQAHRLLGLLDREPHSPGHGSFDREHWAWSLRDFPVNMLQAGMYPLALLWAHPWPENRCHRNPQVLRWLEGAIRETLRRQHPNGAFDSVGPNMPHHGVTLAMVYYLAETLRLVEGGIAPQLREAVRDSLRRACSFAARTSEDYAFISNHQALFALAWLDAAELLNLPEYRARAEQVVEAILRQQSPEGWYREYEGADPGYESLGISYLAAYWQRTRSAKLLDSLRRSVEFFSHFVHPDGSVGGVYGSRHTSLYFPLGFEILAQEIPLAASVATFVRERLSERNVLTPASADEQNLAVLLANYLNASLLRAEQSEKLRVSAAPLAGMPLPCASLDGLRRFPESGLVVAGTPHYYAVLNTAKGGVCRVFDKHSGKIAYEDAGYVVRAGGKSWTSQLIGMGLVPSGAEGSALEPAASNAVSCATQFGEVRRELPTPLKFIALRVLNLTLFRSAALGAWLMRKIVARLITRKRPGPLQLTRSVRFDADAVHFHDRLELSEPAAVREVALPRSFTAIHMGSAKYFHPAELEAVPEAEVTGMVGELNSKGAAEREWTVRLAHAGQAQAAPAAAPSGVEGRFPCPEQSRGAPGDDLHPIARVQRRARPAADDGEN